MHPNDDPHSHQPILRAGPALTGARPVTILLHGRGAGAEDILELSQLFTDGLDGTPVFIGGSDVDARVPLERVHETTSVFRRMGVTVDERIYPGMGHTVNRDELDAVDALLSKTSQ